MRLSFAVSFSYRFDQACEAFEAAYAMHKKTEDPYATEN
eukprot:SAG31_NODE_7880_length_1575_cov_1.536585_1_plen_38_part_10